MAMSFPTKLTSRLEVAFQPLHSSLQTNWSLAEDQARLVERYRLLIEKRLRDDADNGYERTEWKCNTEHDTTGRQWGISLDWVQEPGLGQLTPLQLAHMYGYTYDGEYYTFLMSHNVSSKTDSYVGYTTNPVRDVYLHNERLIPDRNTAAAAGNWELDVVLGPFACKAVAIDCGRTWVHGTRGKLPKRKKAPFLSNAFNVPMYDCRTKLEEPFEDYLERMALPIYNEVLQEMCK